MLAAAPLPGSFSRFYGDASAGGLPVTLPRGRPAATASDDNDDDEAAGDRGALQLSVGDVATVAVQVRDASFGYASTERASRH